MIAENLHVFWGGAVGRFCHLGDVVKQRTLRRGQLRFVEFPFGYCLYGFLVGSLNPQEVGMRIQSIGTTIEPRDPAGDCFLGAPVEVTFRKVHRVTEAHHLAQKIRPMTETLEDAGHLLTTGVGAPLVVDRCNLAGCVRVFHYIDFRLVITHRLQHILARPGQRWKRNGTVRLDRLRKNSAFSPEGTSESQSCPN